MTLDEAIEHAMEVERTCEDTRCAAEHSQLAEWLCELRQVRIDIEVLKIFRDGFKEDAQKYKAENAKLRKFAKNAYRHICTQEGYLRGSGYDSFDYFDTVARELGIEARDD